MVLELAGLRALDRPVAGVVDAGCDLVGEQLAAHVEQLDREHPDVVEVVEQSGRQRLGPRRQRDVTAGSGGGRPAHAEDAALVVVLDQRPAGHRAVDAAHREHRQLAVERHPRLEDERDTAQLVPRPVEVLRSGEDGLALAVVTAAPGLEHRRQASDGFDRAVEIRSDVDRGERGRGDAETTERLLLGEAILRHLERPCPRTYGDVPSEKARRVGGHALPLVRDDGRVARDLAQRGLVTEAADHEVAHRARGRAGDRVEEAELHVEGDAREREHATELAASEHCDDVTAHPTCLAHARFG